MTARPRRGAGIALTAVALAGIGAATLRPAAILGPATFGHFCIVCGGLGLADVINNVVLFVPLGVGLRLAGLRARAALALVVAATVAVELLQLTVITGRFATLGDVLVNTAGGALGIAAVAWWPSLLHSSRRGSRRLALAAGALWLAVLWATAWVMVREPSAGPARPVAIVPPFPEVQWYNGGVVRAVVDGRDVGRPDRLPLAAMGSVRAERARVDAWVTPTNLPRHRFEFFVVVYDPERRSQLVLGRHDRDLIFRVRTRSSDARFRQPAIVVRDAFPAQEPLPPAGTWGEGPATHVAGMLRGHTLLAGIERDGTIAWHEARLSPTIGWALLAPHVRGLDARSALATALWLAGLALPLGYWTARSNGRHGSRAAWPLAGAWLAAGLLALPLALGFPAATAGEWLGAAAGLGAGAALAAAIGRGERRHFLRRPQVTSLRP